MDPKTLFFNGSRSVGSKKVLRPAPEAEEPVRIDPTDTLSQPVEPKKKKATKTGSKAPKKTVREKKCAENPPEVSSKAGMTKTNTLAASGKSEVSESKRPGVSEERSQTTIARDHAGTDLEMDNHTDISSFFEVTAKGLQMLQQTISGRPAADNSRTLLGAIDILLGLFKNFEKLR